MAEELTELQIIDQAIAKIDAEVAARNEADKKLWMNGA